ncbi:hypothetical protein V2I01_01930 [Micromonospora sp. BRA006-A]|nr:hypothetical protein [Micromonospora sp. BRA006-A]
MRDQSYVARIQSRRVSRKTRIPVGHRAQRRVRSAYVARAVLNRSAAAYSAAVSSCPVSPAIVVTRLCASGAVPLLAVGEQVVAPADQVRGQRVQRGERRRDPLVGPGRGRAASRSP